MEIVKRDVKANALTVMNVPYEVDEEYGEMIASHVAYKVSKMMDYMADNGIPVMDYEDM